MRLAPERFRVALTQEMRIVTIRNVNASLPAGSDRPPSGDRAPERSQAARTPAPRTNSRTLLGEGGELVIEHDGREYRLRITQNGKLILTA